VVGQIRATDTGAHTFVGDGGDVIEGIAGPVIAVRLGIQDVTDAAPPLEIRLQAEGITRLVQRVDHDDTVDVVTKPWFAPRRPVSAHTLAVSCLMPCSVGRSETRTVST